MGVGHAKVRVTRFYTYTPSSQGTNSNFVSELVRDSVSSQEFNRFAQDFSYTKLKRITITCVPNATSTQLPMFIKLDWIDSEAQDVTFDDNSKIIWMNTIRPITYKFKPPNILLNNLNNEAPIKINYTEWQDSKTLVAENIPGYVKVTCALMVRLIMEVTWVFRGYNAKYPYTIKEIINNNGKEVKKEDDIGEIIRDLKTLALKKDQVEEQEEKKIEKEKKEKEKKTKRSKSNKNKSVDKNEIKEEEKESDSD